MDDEPMWATDRVIALTPGSAIIIPKTTNEFSIKASGIFLYKILNQAYQLLEDKVLLKIVWDKNQITKSSLKKTIAFAAYKEFQSHSKQPKLDDDDIPMLREEEAKFMQTFRRTCFYNDYRDRDSNRDNWRSSGRNDYNRDNYQSHFNDKPDLQKQLSDFIKAQHSTNSFVKVISMDLKNKLETTTKNHQASIQNLKAKFDILANKQSGRPSRFLPSNTQPNQKGSSSKPYQPPQARDEHVNVVFTQSGKSYDPPDNPNDQQNNSETPINFDSDDEDEEPIPQPKLKTLKPAKETPIPKPINVIDEILEEDFDALLDEGSEILHSIEGTILEEKLFVEFDEFMEMTVDENSESESDTEEPQFKKITINTDYKIKTSLEEPPMDLELKPLPDNLEYVFLEEPSFLPVIISSQLFEENKNNLCCKDAHLVLNWKKCHFMVKEGIVLGHKYSWTISPSLEALLITDWKISIKCFSVAKMRILSLTRKNVTSWHLFKKQDAKPRLIRWILPLQEFDIEIKDRKGNIVTNSRVTPSWREIVSLTFSEAGILHMNWISFRHRTTYKNMFDSISVTRTQTKTMIDSLQNKLHDTISKNAKLRAQLFDKVSKQKDTTHGTSENTKFTKQSILGKQPSSSRSKLYSVNPLPKSKFIPKYKDVKTLFAAIETRFGGNEATKKNQKTLPNKLYENFSASSTKSLNSNFNRLQKIRNKSDLDTMSIDDLYNNFKIVEQEERNLSEIKQVDQYAQAISLITAIVDRYISNKQGEDIQQAIMSYTAKYKEEALAERREHILPQVVLEFATPVIERNITGSLEVVVLAKSSSQPKSTYEAAASLSEELYGAMVKSSNTNKDLFDTYGKVFLSKKSRDDKDKDQNPSIGSDRGTKRRKSSNDAESSRDPKSKESKSTSSSKVTSHSQHTSSGKSAHAKEQSHIVDDSGSEWYKKPEQPLTPDPYWNKRQHVDFRLSQTWISNIARAKKPPTSFDELMDTPIDFSAFVMNWLNITNLTQELLVGPTFNLIKGICKSRTELEYHFEECFKATTERLY
nr:reverse transcriptase domain-containing protein [Tanacetum cinerariifolium]